MRRSFWKAASLVVLLTLPVWAQHRGSSFHGISSAGAQSHPVRSFSGGPRYNFGSFDSNFHITQDFGRPPGYPLLGGRAEFNHRGFHSRRSFYPYGAYFPYYSAYWDPYYASDFQSRYENYDAEGSVYTEHYNPHYRKDGNLERDVQTLNGKIDRLQADVEAQNVEAQNNDARNVDARNQPTEEQPLTALVFRDQHVLEVRNYVISGGTLWVLSERQSKKIPLGELDLEATAKMNDDRGVNFQTPK